MREIFPKGEELTTPPGLRTLKISPYTPSHDGACTVASIAYTANKTDNVTIDHKTMRQRVPTSIKVILAKLFHQFHEVALDKGDVIQTSLPRILRCALDLEVVVIQPDDLSVCELGDFASGASNTTTDVEDTHARADVHLRSEVVLMSGKGGEEGFALVEP